MKRSRKNGSLRKQWRTGEVTKMSKESWNQRADELRKLPIEEVISLCVDYEHRLDFICRALQDEAKAFQKEMADLERETAEWQRDRNR